MSDQKNGERKIINLDELIPEVQVVILDKKQHEIQAASVDMYLQVMKKRQRMKNADSELEQIEMAVDLITLAVPSISRERLGKLPLKALLVMADVIQDQMADSVEGSEGERAMEVNTEAGE